MAVGFRSGGTDLDDIFVRDTEFDAADIAAKLRAVDGAGSGLNAAKLGGSTLAQVKCSGCSWTCSSGCTGGCRTGCTGCTGSCTGGCTGCTGSCSTGCGRNCTGKCSGACSTGCEGPP